MPFGKYDSGYRNVVMFKKIFFPSGKYSRDLISIQLVYPFLILLRKSKKHYPLPKSLKGDFIEFISLS